MWIEKAKKPLLSSVYCVWKWGNEVDSTRDLSTSTWQWWRVFATVFEWENFRSSHQKENVSKESLFARMILRSSRNTWLQSSTAARINSLRSDIFLLCLEEKKSFPLSRHLVNVMSWWVASFQHVHFCDWARVDGDFRERKCLVLTVCSPLHCCLMLSSTNSSVIMLTSDDYRLIVHQQEKWNLRKIEKITLMKATMMVRRKWFARDLIYDEHGILNRNVFDFLSFDNCVRQAMLNVASNDIKLAVTSSNLKTRTKPVQCVRNAWIFNFDDVVESYQIRSSCNVAT